MRTVLHSALIPAILVMFTSSCKEDGFSAEPGRRVNGRVVDRATVQPLSDVVVELSGPVTYSESALLLVDTTDATGVFEFDRLTRDEVSLTASYNGYCPVSDKVQLNEGVTTHDLQITSDTLRPIVSDGWAVLDSIKVSCDNAPINYTYQYRCRLEDKETFRPLEYVAFYLTIGYQLYHDDPSAVLDQEGFLRARFADIPEKGLFVGDYSRDHLEDDGVFHWQSTFQMEWAISGTQMEHLAADEDFGIDDIDLTFEVWYTYAPCGSNEVRRVGVPLSLQTR